MLMINMEFLSFTENFLNYANIFINLCLASVQLMTKREENRDIFYSLSELPADQLFLDFVTMKNVWKNNIV